MRLLPSRASSCNLRFSLPLGALAVLGGQPELECSSQPEWEQATEDTEDTEDAEHQLSVWSVGYVGTVGVVASG
jgi:hypothetical protein